MALHSKGRFHSWEPALFDGQFHWDFLKPAWQHPLREDGKRGKIEPMDFDAVVERNGRFLVFETKIPGQEIPLGQSITLTAKWKQGATIFVLAGKEPKEISGISIYWEGAYEDGVKVGSKPMQQCNAYDVVFQARRWFCRASGVTLPDRDVWDNQLWTWDYERAEPKDAA